MPNLLAMSFEGEMTPGFDLRCLSPGKKPPDGWGIGYYPAGEPAAAVLKEPAPASGSLRSALVHAWENVRSSVFVVHIRSARWGALTDANTQPFHRPWGRRDWLMAHSGSLDHRMALASRFEPVGSTDSEEIFCELLARIAANEWKSIGDCDLPTLASWFRTLNENGSLTTVLTDGRDLVVYADRRRQGPVYTWEVLPPHGQTPFGDDDLVVDLARRGVKSRKGIIISTEPLPFQRDSSELPPEWHEVLPGHLLVIRQGAIVGEVAPPSESPDEEAPPRARARPPVPPRGEPRTWDVRHRTVYRYATAVERSAHLLRLEPRHDPLQTLISHDLEISVGGRGRGYEDVFGNRVRRVLVESPYQEMVVDARSRVRVLDTDPFDFHPLRTRSTIPLVWMPWQRQILQPFLLPAELPESQLAELGEYAMSFVTRNDSDLIDTLLDINWSIFKEYEYRPGATSVASTAFEAYANRHGVCQDFTNLFICLARLLGVPARYTCGYIYTGEKNPNQRQSEASHAWVQLYLPEVGWRGFDPTNGILTQTEHIRVAVGRNYVDATPTSGTIYAGGGAEILEVEVRVDPVNE